MKVKLTVISDRGEVYCIKPSIIENEETDPLYFPYDLELDLRSDDKYRLQPKDALYRYKLFSGEFDSGNITETPDNTIEEWLRGNDYEFFIRDMDTSIRKITRVSITKEEWLERTNSEVVTIDLLETLISQIKEERYLPQPTTTQPQQIPVFT